MASLEKGYILGPSPEDLALRSTNERDILLRLEKAAEINPPIAELAHRILQSDEYADPIDEVSELLKKHGIN